MLDSVNGSQPHQQSDTVLFLERCEPFIRRTAKRYLLSKHIDVSYEDDLVQRGLLRIFRHIKRKGLPFSVDADAQTYREFTLHTTYRAFVNEIRTQTVRHRGRYSGCVRVLFFETSRVEEMRGKGCVSAVDENDLSVESFRQLLMTSVDRAARVLSARERKVLELYFYESLTQRKIGKEMGCTQERVSQLLASALRKIRSTLGLMNASKSCGCPICDLQAQGMSPMNANDHVLDHDPLVLCRTHKIIHADRSR